MDTRDGSIWPEDSEELKKRMKEAHQKKFGDLFVRLLNQPDPNCKRCFGRGHTGFNVTTARFEPCKCTKPDRGTIPL